jgi:putative SOS response-associated peptidase YedK
MCGRYTLKTGGQSVAKLFELTEERAESVIEPRYNIAPTQRIPVVSDSEVGEGGRELRMMRWGLIQHCS